MDERNAGEVGTTRYDHDPLGQLLTVTDARGFGTGLVYDWLGRRTSLASPDAGTTSFEYDGAGNLIAKRDSRKVTIRYVYEYDQLRRIEYPNAQAVTFDYGPPGAPENGASRIVRVGDDAGTETRGYGKLGELVRTTRTIPALRPGDVEKVFETRFAFDSYGRMQWIKYPDGETVRYGYDAGGLVRSARGKRPATKHYPAAEETYLASLEYDEHGQRRMVTLGNGATTRYDYYPESLRLEALHTEAGGQILQALTYRYDRVGNVRGMTNSLPPPTTMRSGPVSFEFAYDDLYRLTSATGTAQSRAHVVDSFLATYEYDVVHNMERNTQVHDSAITKGELCAYYEAVAPLMIPHVRGRPITMERFPAGIEKKGFIQKDVSKGFPSWLERVEVEKRNDKAGESVHYPLVGDARSLIWLANQNSVTPHVWISRVPKLLQPDLCVFDLDPSTEDPQSLRTAALAVRELLDEFALPSYVKTSGSKGFHILVPLDGEGDAESVWRFAHGAGAVLVKRHPHILTQEFIKADRGDRIFVDTGRNLPGATFAAVYAVRAKLGAPISAPCTWAELEGGTIGPRTFTLRAMAARIGEVGELWSGMDDRRCSLREATAKLRTMLTDADRNEALAASTRRPVSRKAPRKQTRASTRNTPSKARR